MRLVPESALGSYDFFSWVDGATPGSLLTTTLRLPSMSTVDTATTTEPLDEHGSAVRFESQCVVIPDSAYRSRRPRVVTKSYVLPLWRRRASSGSPSTSKAPPEDAACEENPSHLILRVPLPTFSLKSYPTTRPADHPPLPSCLIHRPQPSDPSCPSPLLNRHVRTPRKPSHSPSRSDIVTVPLRPCCVACQPVTEAALVDALPEHFSRAASRRRSLSVDGPRTITVAGSAASASYGALGVAISVDEIDRRRRASDLGPSTTSRELCPEANRDECEASPNCHRTTMSGIDANPPPSPCPSRKAATPATPCIPEEEDDENENELFPLPSPKRTPSASPAPSITGSISSLVTPANRTSPASSMCSGESAQPAQRRLLAPPPFTSSSSSSSSSLSLPVLPGSTTDLSAGDPPRVPSPNLLSTLPSISGRHHSPPPVPSDSPSLSVLPTPVPVQQHPPSSPHHSPMQPRLPWRPRRTTTALTENQGPALEASPPTSSVHGKRFSMSSPLQIFSDVLRGVGAIGPGAGGIAGV